MKNDTEKTWYLDILSQVLDSLDLKNFKDSKWIFGHHILRYFSRMTKTDTLKAKTHVYWEDFTGFGNRGTKKLQGRLYQRWQLLRFFLVSQKSQENFKSSLEFFNFSQEFFNSTKLPYHEIFWKLDTLNFKPRICFCVT